jgi:methylmalonyl-CoA mutase N-terminal domain/subunit
LRFHAQTAGSTLTAHQAENNAARVAFQALSAILGGAQSLHTNARDEAFALPSESAAQLALRTQQILAFETGVPDVTDPLGGSWYLESLTSRLEVEATAYMKRIRDMGGMARAIETGFAQREIQNSAYEQQKSFESNERVVVGVNRFTSGEEPSLELLKIAPDIEERQIKKLGKLKKRRSAGKVRDALHSVTQAAESSDNLMPPILDAVRSYATVGEISDALRQVLGEHRESVAV